MTRLATLLYPQLRSFPESERTQVLHRANSTSFDVVELLGMALGLVLTTAVTRYGVADLNPGERIAAILLNFALALCLLLVLVGPFFIRRARRGLDSELANRSDPTPRNERARP